MGLQKCTRIVIRRHRFLVVLGASAVVALGAGPLISIGLKDILGSNATPALGIGTIVALFVLSLSCAAMARSLKNRFSASTSVPKYKVAFSIGILLAGLSFAVASIDSTNSTAWRNARSFSAEAGVDSRQVQEYGNHFGRLQVETSSAPNKILGHFPVRWEIWVTGGEYQLLIRVRPLTNDLATGRCDSDGLIELEAMREGKVLAENSISMTAACERWTPLDLASPRGAEELRLGIERGASSSTLRVDVLVSSSQPDLPWIWFAVIVLAVGTVFGFVFWLAQISRDGESTVHKRRDERSPSKRTTVLALLFFLLVGNIFVFSFVAQEKTIYTWDNAGYWTSAIGVSEFVRGGERKSTVQQRSDQRRLAEASPSQDPGVTLPSPGAIAALIRNIRFAEYNVTTSLPIAPAMALFGGSRMVYELSLLNIYALAAVILLVFAVRACGRVGQKSWPKWWPFVPVFVALSFVPFWVPILRGYMGISIVAPSLAVLWLYFSRPALSASTASLVAIGALLVASVFLQRWNAYWVIGFLVLAIMDGFYALYKRRKISLTTVIQSFRAPMIAGFTAFCIFAVVAWPKIVTMVTTDYADIFSAYLEHTSLFTALLRVLSDTGLALTFFILAAFVYLIANRSTQRMATLLGIHVVFVFVHMSSTQTMGAHHLYVLMPAILIVLSVAAIQSVACDKPRVSVVGSSLMLIFLVSGCVSTIRVFVPSQDRIADSSSILLLSNDYRPPLVRHDLEEFVRLARFLDTTLESEPDGAGVYVLGGSQTLNAEHFQNIGASLGGEYLVSERILPGSVVDKRDGFPGEILMASLVVTSDPVQLSRKPADQQVIQIPANSLMSGTGIGTAFERLIPTFQLDGNVEVAVFRRIRPNTQEEITGFSEKLKALYPDRPFVYE